jgi:hypothetical protein
MTLGQLSMMQLIVTGAVAALAVWCLRHLSLFGVMLVMNLALWIVLVSSVKRCVMG